MKNLVVRTGVLILILATASCASQKKLDFSNAYKFSHIGNTKVTNANEKVEVKQGEDEDPNLRGSLDKLSPKTPNLELGGVGSEVSIEEPIDLASNTEAIRSAYKKLTKTERKQVRKTLRQSIRDITVESLDNNKLKVSLKDVEPAQDEKKKRIAKYLLIGGGALVILAIIIGSVPVLTTIGIVAVVVGAILMILSLS